MCRNASRFQVGGELRQIFIMVNGRSKHYIGGFTSQMDAARMYDKAAIQLKGMKVLLSDSGPHQLQLHEGRGGGDHAG